MKKKRVFSSIVVIGALTTAAAAAFYYSRATAVHAGTTVEPSDVTVEEAPDTNVIEVDRPGRFKTVAVSSLPVQDQLRVTGSVAPDVNRTVPVISLASGRVVEIRARLGDFVNKGQILLVISSPDLTSAFSDYQKFVADETLARRQLERSQMLYSRGAVAQKDLQVAEDTEQKAKVDVSTTAERIRILGGDAGHQTSLIEIAAPISGVIVEQNVTGAAGVKSLDNSPNLFTIADLSRVWVLCDVYENDLAKVRMGQAAEVRFNAFPDRVLPGRVSNIGQVLDPSTRAAKVRLEIDNPGGMLRPNMFGTITFFSPGKSKPAIPATAMLRLHDKTWVFVADSPKRFTRKEVVPGAALTGGMQEIVAGLSPREEVAENALSLSSAGEVKE